MEQQKSCENCYYFYQHYFKNKRGKLSMICGDGHCANEQLTFPVSKKIISKRLPCELWQPKENQIAEKRENIFSLLFKMKERLDEIALILKDDDL